MRPIFSQATSRREIRGVSGWDLINPLLGHMPDEMMDKVQKCESPIEQLFAAALWVATNAIPPTKRPQIEVQVQIDRYRADIVVVGPNGAPRIVVECDGAEFHTDVRKDAKRTEAIERMGYRVFRHTGSEIHHNPIGHAAEILRAAGMMEKRTA